MGREQVVEVASQGGCLLQLLAPLPGCQGLPPRPFVSPTKFSQRVVALKIW